MKFIIETEKLSKMLSNSVRGASNNVMLPITSLVCLEVKDNFLTITTTDGINIMKVIEPLQNEDFYIVVEFDKLYKLVSKTTMDMMIFEVEPNYLKIKGNGTYKIDIPLNESGENIIFPDYFKGNFKDESNVKLAKLTGKIIQSMRTLNRSSVAKTTENPSLTGYYVGEGQIVTTNGIKVCSTKGTLFEEPILLPSDLVDMLAVFQSENEIDVILDENKILFKSINIEVYGNLFEKLEKFPITALNNFIKMDFECECVIDRNAMINILERLNLFTNALENKAIKLLFNQNSIEFFSKKSAGVEILPFVKSSQNAKPFFCYVDLDLLKSQLSVQVDDTIKVCFGNTGLLKMVSVDSIQILALMNVQDKEFDGGEIEKPSEDLTESTKKSSKAKNVKTNGKKAKS